MQRSVFINLLNELKDCGIIDYNATGIKILDNYALRDISNIDIDSYIENNP